MESTPEQEEARLRKCAYNQERKRRKREEAATANLVAAESASAAAAATAATSGTAAWHPHWGFSVPWSPASAPVVPLSTFKATPWSFASHPYRLELRAQAIALRPVADLSSTTGAVREPHQPGRENALLKIRQTPPQCDPRPLRHDRGVGIHGSRQPSLTRGSYFPCNSRWRSGHSSRECLG